MAHVQIDPNDLPYRLPVDAYAYLVQTLDRHLPPPPDPSEETATLRKHAIIARISALHPNDSVEAVLAANFVIANEQAGDCDHWVQIHLAAERYKLANQCPAQSQERDRARPQVGARESRSQTKTREATRALRELDRRQASTKKRQADPVATEAAERIEHITTTLLAEGYDRIAQPQKPEPTPAAITAAAAPPAEPAPTLTRIEPPVSPPDLKTRKHKTETAARQTSKPLPDWLKPPPSHLVGESPDFMQLRFERDTFAPSPNEVRHPEPAMHAEPPRRPA